MNIKAKFKGANGSLGYENGKTYQLEFKTTDKIDDRGKIVEQIRVLRRSGSMGAGICYYDSLKAFLNNWQVIGEGLKIVNPRVRQYLDELKGGAYMRSISGLSFTREDYVEGLSYFQKFIQNCNTVGDWQHVNQYYHAFLAKEVSE